MSTKRAGLKQRGPAKARSRHGIDVRVAGASWNKALRTPAAVAQRAGRAALVAAPKTLTAEISVLLTGDAALRELNRTYRGKDNPTNVLSFPAFAPEDLPKRGTVGLGDIAVAYGVTSREARAEGKTVKAHLSHLVVHGVLHLLGYDHERDKDAAAMEHMERKILAGLGIADPYAEAPLAQTSKARRRAS